jgi:O-antigen/teichoic acid export membrane protein
VKNLFKVQQNNVEFAIKALQIAGLGIGVRFLDSVFRSIMHGYERYDLAAKVSMTINIFTILINLFLVIFGYGVVQILSNTVIIVMISAVIKALLARKLLLRQLIFWPSINKKALKEIFGFGFYSWLQGIGSIFLGHIDKFLIASMFDMSALAYYGICLQISQQIHGLLAKAASFVFPLSSSMKELGDLDQLRRIYFIGLNYITTIAIGIGLPIFCFSKEFLIFWLGAQFATEATNILQILIFASVLLSTSIVPYYYMNGTGFVRLNTVLGLISGTVVAVSSVYMMLSFGILGAAWARLFNFPINIIGRTIVHYKVLKDHRWYAGIIIFLPPIFVFGSSTLLLRLFAGQSINMIILISIAIVIGILGVTISSFICGFFNTPQFLYHKSFKNNLWNRLNLNYKSIKNLLF